jgi:hypothetical protein
VGLDRREEQREVALGEEAVLEIEDDVVDAPGGQKLCGAWAGKRAPSADQ